MAPGEKTSQRVPPTRSSRWMRSEVQMLSTGAFYPADSKELEKMVDELVARTQVPEIKEPVLAVVSPHAGYPYSGPVAAYSYAVLKGRKFARVVVISPSHFEGFSFASVYQGSRSISCLQLNWQRAIR